MSKAELSKNQKQTAVQSWRNGIAVRIPDRLSDAVMTFPALKELKKIIPEHCGLFVIIPSFMTQLFEALPIVDKTVSLRKSDGSMWSRNERREVRQLRAGAIVLFNNSPADVISARLARIPQLFGFAGTRSGLLLSSRTVRPGHPENPDHHSPIAMQYLELASSVGAGTWDGKLPRISSRIATYETDPVIEGLCTHVQMLLIAPGVTGPPCLDPSIYRTAAKYWIRHGGIVAVIGSASERSRGNAVTASLPKNKIFNLCGKTDFCALLHLFRHAAYTLAGDSGLMRLGIALDIHGLIPVGPADFLETDPVTAKWRVLASKSVCKKAGNSCEQGGNCPHPPTAKQLLKAIKKAADELHFPFRKVPIK